MEVRFRARQEEPAAFQEAARSLGVTYYQAARLWFLIQQGVTEDNYLDGERMARLYTDLRAIEPDLAGAVRLSLESILNALSEPEELQTTGFSDLNAISRRIYWAQVERYYLARGDLEAALDPTDQGVRRAITAYRTAQDARELRSSASAAQENPGAGLLRLVRLLADSGEREQVASECRSLRQRFESWYERFPPTVCEEATR